MTDGFRDNDTAHHFELTEEGLTAFASYRRNGDIVIIPHVEAPLPLRGKGTADRLMRNVIEEARSKGFKIMPTCAYAKIWFKRHPDAADVLAP